MHPQPEKSPLVVSWPLLRKAVLEAIVPLLSDAQQ